MEAHDYIVIIEISTPKQPRQILIMGVHNVTVNDMQHFTWCISQTEGIKFNAGPENQCRPENKSDLTITHRRSA